MLDPDTTDRDGDRVEQLWPMGAVTRRTGIGEHTLRAWERRFGSPMPERLPSGHRRYTAGQVQQLLLITEALRCGYRAGDVVRLPMQELEELLRAAGSSAEQAEASAPEWMAEILELSRRFDRDGLVAKLQHDAMTFGVREFLRDRVAPTLVEVGEAWTRDELAIRNEHFFSEVLEDVLRSLRTPLESTSKGRPVVLATLPDEYHGLGLQIVALAIAASGRRLRILGPHTPLDEIVEAVHAVDAAAVGLSVSAFANSDEAAQQITDIRRRLATRVRLWVGGAGAQDLEGVPVSVQMVDDLDELDRALRQLGE